LQKSSVNGNESLPSFAAECNNNNKEKDEIPVSMTIDALDESRKKHIYKRGNGTE
jgi:hypothetical protein